MKKIIFTLTAVVAAALCGCQGNQSAPTQPKPNGLEKAAGNAASGLVAYVELDSFDTQYQFCKDQVEALTAKQNEYQKKLEAEENALTSLSNKVQQNLQSGVYKTEEEYNKAIANGQQKQQAYMKHGAQYEQEMAEARQAYHEEFFRRVRAYLKEYNRDGRYAMILTTSEGAPSVLYADSSLNITKDIIAGLNKAYKK